MPETNTGSTPAATQTPNWKKMKAVGAKTVSTHPTVAQMVNAAIKSLKERGGSSTQAIKKYISSTFKIDAEKKSQFIRKYLKSAVASGALVQTKGKGASGSFKLAVLGDKKPAAASKTKKTAAVKKAPATKAKKTKSPTKKAPAKAAAPKAKMTTKPPTAAKSPKPKVLKAKKTTTPKVKKLPPQKKAAKKPAPKKATPKKK